MKKMVSRLTVLLVMATFGIFLLAATGSAAPITGEIQFEGTSQLTDKFFNPATTFASAEGLQFSDVTVELTTGDFFGLDGATATYEDFIFHSFAGPVTPLWTAGAFSFDLETLDVLLHTDKMLGMEGSGTLKADGYDDTKGAWILTTQTVTGLTEITFSAAAGSVAVPEPGTLLLLGSGMAGLALYRRRSTNN